MEKMGQISMIWLKQWENGGLMVKTSEKVEKFGMKWRLKTEENLRLLHFLSAFEIFRIQKCKKTKLACTAYEVVTVVRLRVRCSSQQHRSGRSVAF